MTDHKFTGDDVIKALEICAKLDFSLNECKECPYKDECGTKDGNMPADALALINRQKVEIKILQKSLVEQFDGYESIRKKAKSEAIKEFAENLTQDIKSHRLEMNLNGLKGTHRTDEMTYETIIEYIDTLVKEMTEGGE